MQMNQFQKVKQIIRSVVLCALLSISTILSRSLQVKYMTPKNMRNIMGCKTRDPITCQTSQEWVLLFFNSNNHRQWSTFQYLIPGFNKQIRFAQQNQDNENTQRSSNTKTWEYPSSAVIDCYSSPSLCQSIGSQDLPLVIYRSNENDPIRYQGYVTLSGLISFIKTHDPSTSYMASYFKPTGERIYSKMQDFSQKQINDIFEKLKQNQNTKKQQQKIERVQLNQQNKSGKQSQLINNGSSTIQRQASNNVKEEAFSHQVKINADDLTAQSKQIEIENNNILQSERIEMQVWGDRKAQKQKKSKKGGKKQKNKQKQKQDKKKQSASFNEFVQSSTQFVVSIFSELGISGYLLQIISQIAYIFFTVLYGILFVLVQAL